MGQGATLLDLLIALLQSLVVLLLASGVYVALLVRKSDDSPHPGEPGPATSPRGPRSLTASQGDSPGA
jgi:flagellar basal body-associated protein FliL